MSVQPFRLTTANLRAWGNDAKSAELHVAAQDGDLRALRALIAEGVDVFCCRRFFLIITDAFRDAARL